MIYRFDQYTLDTKSLELTAGGGDDYGRTAGL